LKRIHPLILIFLSFNVVSCSIKIVSLLGDPPEGSPRGSPRRIPRRIPWRIPWKPPEGSPSANLNFLVVVFFFVKRIDRDTVLDRSGLTKIFNVVAPSSEMVAKKPSYDNFLVGLWRAPRNNTKLGKKRTLKPHKASVCPPQPNQQMVVTHLPVNHFG
jgi:hypothetical protein